MSMDVELTLSNDVQLEGQVAHYRQQLFALLSANHSFNVEAINLLWELMSQVGDTRDHGVLLWALMEKQGQGLGSQGVLGTHFMYYLHHYYFVLVKASQRQNFRRSLDLPSLAFLTTIAAFGWQRGCDEFDKAFLQAKSVDPINALVITRPMFLKFFWGGNDDTFSFLHAWRLIDRLWDIFDQMPPRIHGFVTAQVSARMLNIRVNQPGSFLFRFSSMGGLAVDYVSQGKILKTHWKFSELEDCAALRKKLFDKSRDANYLLLLVDSTQDPLTVPLTVTKEIAFPAQVVDNGYQSSSGTGYENVDDAAQHTGYINFDGF